VVDFLRAGHIYDQFIEIYSSNKKKVFVLLPYFYHTTMLNLHLNAGFFCNAGFFIILRIFLVTTYPYGYHYVLVFIIVDSV